MSHETNSPIDAPIDAVHLNQISEGDVEFEVEVLQIYVKDVLQRIHKMRQAITTSDRAHIMMEAHHIKGSSANVGALQMKSLAIQIEKLDQYQNSGQAFEIIDNMLEEMRAVELFTAHKLANLSS